MQILKALSGCYNKAWINHPCVKMWQGYEVLLELYYNVCINVWKYRGHKNTMLLIAISPDISIDKYWYQKIIWPDWWGSKIHSTHRAALLAKNYEYYKQFNWTEEPKIDYYWPVK